MKTLAPRLLTTGRMADALGQPVHRVTYILATRPHIQPAARAGTLRLFDRRALAMVRHEIDAIDARQTRKAVRDDQ